MHPQPYETSTLQISKPTGSTRFPRFPLVKNSEERRNFAFMKNRVLKNDHNSRPCWCSANLEFRFSPKTDFYLKLTPLVAPQAKIFTLVVGMFGLANLSCFFIEKQCIFYMISNNFCIFTMDHCPFTFEALRPCKFVVFIQENQPLQHNPKLPLAICQ